MSWQSLPLVTDDDLGAIEPSATAETAPWGATTWPAQRDQARRELGVWIDADFGPGATDRVLDRWSPTAAFRSTSGALVDILSDVANDTEEDVDVAAALATPATDALYIGLDSLYSGLEVQLLDSLNAAPSALSVAYWGPAGWTALTIQDGTALNGATCARSGRVQWDLPDNWARRRFGGSADEHFFVRLMVSHALTPGTAATQILPARPSEGLRLVAARLALSIVFMGLAAQAADPTAWVNRADLYREGATTLYDRLKQSGGLLLDTNRDQVIDPVERATPRPVRLQRG